MREGLFEAIANPIEYEVDDLLLALLDHLLGKYILFPELLDGRGRDEKYGHQPEEVGNKMDGIVSMSSLSLHI